MSAENTVYYLVGWEVDTRWEAKSAISGDSFSRPRGGVVEAIRVRECVCVCVCTEKF